MKIFPSFGGASYSENSVKVIRLLRKGCANRPFFHISVQEHTKEVFEPVIEQIGSYDPYPNKHNEKLIAINFKRLEHWIRANAKVSAPVCALLGLAGYYPIHPKTFESAWQNRQKISKLLEELKITAANLETSETSESSSETVADSSESPDSSHSTEEQSEQRAEDTTPSPPETKT